MSGKRLKALRKEFFELNGRYPRRSRQVASFKNQVLFKSEWRELKRFWINRRSA